MVPRETFEDRQQRFADGFRARAVKELLSDLLDEGRIGDDESYALAMLITDATLDGDEASLHSASRQLQLLYRALTRSRSAELEEIAEDRGRVLAFLDIAAWGLERALALDALSELERDSTAHEFIKAVVERPGSTNYEIATMLSTSDAEISRVGRRLTDAGLAAKRRVGRRNHWEVTPKGIHALDLLESGGASRLRRPNLQLQ